VLFKAGPCREILCSDAGPMIRRWNQQDLRRHSYDRTISWIGRNGSDRSEIRYPTGLPKDQVDAPPQLELSGSTTIRTFRLQSSSERPPESRDARRLDYALRVSPRRPKLGYPLFINWIIRAEPPAQTGGQDHRTDASFFEWLETPTDQREAGRSTLY
jgi:hypothetical protein